MALDPVIEGVTYDGCKGVIVKCGEIRANFITDLESLQVSFLLEIRKRIGGSQNFICLPVDGTGNLRVTQGIVTDLPQKFPACRDRLVSGFQISSAQGAFKPDP